MPIPHAGDLVPELLERRRRAGRMLVALDFDGTLSPIVPRPGDAALLEGLDRPLRRLAAREDTEVAIVSGRGLGDVRSRVQLDGIYYAGNHGFEIEGRGVDRVLTEAQEARPALEAAAEALAEALADEPGAEVEDKGWTLTIHYRRAEREGAEERVRDAVRREGGRPGLRVTEGKKVFEIRPDVDWHKGRATRFLLDTVASGGDLPAIFIGDDRTDEDAFEVVREIGGGIVVGEPPADTRAVAWLRGPEEVRDLITRLADGEDGDEDGDGDAAAEWSMFAFAAGAGGGNPAGVVLDPPRLSPEEMTRTAVRLNPLSETAFVGTPADGVFPLRYFAPGGEVALCGHATAAAFGALAMAGRIGELPARVRSTAPGGDVSGRVEEEGEGGVLVWMDMPVARRVDASLDMGDIAEAVGLPVEVMTSRPAAAVEDVGIRVALLPVADLAALDAMRPDFDRLQTLGRPDDIIVFYPFVLDPDSGRVRARSFAPAVDIDEDPATGTAAASLAAFLAREGLVEEEAELRIRQGEAMGHPSEIRVRVEHRDRQPRRVVVGGIVRGTRTT